MSRAASGATPSILDIGVLSFAVLAEDLSA